MEIKESQSKKDQHFKSENYRKRNSLYSIPDPDQKNMDELIASIREKLQQILSQA